MLLDVSQIKVDGVDKTFDCHSISEAISQKSEFYRINPDKDHPADSKFYVSSYPK